MEAHDIHPGPSFSMVELRVDMNAFIVEYTSRLWMLVQMIVWA